MKREKKKKNQETEREREWGFDFLKKEMKRERGWKFVGDWDDRYNMRKEMREQRGIIFIIGKKRNKE